MINLLNGDDVDRIIKDEVATKIWSHFNTFNCYNNTEAHRKSTRTFLLMDLSK